MQAHLEVQSNLVVFFFSFREDSLLLKVMMILPLIAVSTFNDS